MRTHMRCFSLGRGVDEGAWRKVGTGCLVGGVFLQYVLKGVYFLQTRNRVAHTRCSWCQILEGVLYVHVLYFSGID